MCSLKKDRVNGGALKLHSAMLCNETVIDALKPSWIQAANYSSNPTHIHTQSVSSNDKGESSLSNLVVQVAVYYTRSQIMFLIIKEKKLLTINY